MRRGGRDIGSMLLEAGFTRSTNMNIHEYQAKQLLAQYGVAVPQGQPCKTVDEARGIAEKIFASGHTLAVVKSQIHAAGGARASSRAASRGA